MDKSLNSKTIPESLVASVIKSVFTKLRNIKRLWYKISFVGEDRALYVHALKGKFKVLYPDGKQSQNFSYKVAKNYSEMFGGKVIDAF